MRTIKINKPTHKFFTKRGTPAIAIAQKRGDTLQINTFDERGKLQAKSWAVGMCASRLTNYGKGVASNDQSAVEAMHSAWRFTFGSDFPLPDYCETHGMKQGESGS